MDLDCRGLGTQNNVVRNIERILHVAGRVLGRQVQRFEIVVVCFDFGAAFDIKAQLFENRTDFFHGKGDGVSCTFPWMAARQSGIETFDKGLLGEVLEGFLACFKQGGELFLDPVCNLACLGALFRSKRGQFAHDGGKLTLAAKEFHAQTFQFIGCRGFFEAFFQFRCKAFQSRNDIHV